MNSMYYIYHIEGVKIGCSTNPKERVRRQGYLNYSILESYNDINIAAKREIELQKIYGYIEKNIGTDYVQQYQYGVKGREAAKGLGAKAQIENKIGIWALNKNQRSKIQKNASKFGGVAQSQIIRTCPHCGKVGKGNGMFGAHFDRCKLINGQA